MDPISWGNVVSALLGGLPAMLLAAFGLATARLARSKALEAEREAKQSDELRTKILSAGESLLALFGEIAISFETVAWHHKRGADQSTILEAFKQAADAAAELRRLTYRNAAILPDEFRARLFSILSRFSTLELTPAGLSSTNVSLNEIHKQLASTIRVLAGLPPHRESHSPHSALPVIAH